ncbi:MAG: XRE family transcriptional regulator [Alphaproteobacteria bacterium]|jgi:predicted XRE-type DNA-binding protein|nr:XRE family transcriptional regulator [Alphaproteobacteria bacterium]
MPEDSGNRDAIDDCSDHARSAPRSDNRGDEIEELEVVRGSGNVWRDFGRPDADLEQAKDTLAARILGIMESRGLSARAAASQTGFDAGDFSRIRNANYGRFTVDRLIRMLLALDNKLKVRLDIQADHETRP